MRHQKNLIFSTGLAILSLFFVSVSKAEEAGGTTEKVLGTTEPHSHLPGHPVPNPADKLSLPEPKGTEVQLGNLTIYESPFKNESKTLLISIHDVFGLHSHVKFIADQVAEAGPFRVVTPDFFYGKAIPVDTDLRTIKGLAEKIRHLTSRNGSWVEVKPELLNIIEKYKEEGITSVGIYGFCWGGLMSVFAATDSDLTDLDVGAIGLVHPSAIELNEAYNMTIPATIMPSYGEPDMTLFLNILNEHVKPESEHRRFDQMGHGFAGASGDFSNSTVRAAVSEVIQRLSKFFTRVLVETE